jgi:hypothetical protein
MVFNATFNNISVISWRSVLLVERIESVVLSMINIQINTWAFPYWPGYHPETPI